MVSGDNVGRIDLDLGINYGAFNRELRGISGNAQSMVGSAFKKLGATIAATFAVKSMIDFGKASVQLASDLTEVQNVVDVTFGAMAEDINQFSKEALNNFGMAELSAKRFSSTMGAMLKSSGLTGQAIVDMSKKITGLTGDMASFYNLSQDEAFQKIRSGLAGETEPLRQLGINMSVANLEAYALSKGIRKSYQEMTQAEQTLLRYNYLLNATKDAQGDFARTSDSWANQVRLMGEQWKIFQSTMGQGFINVLTPVIKGLNTLIQKLQIAAQYFKAFTEMVFGAQKATAQGAAAAATAAVSMDGMSDASAGVGDAVKKTNKELKRSVGSFDQLNVLTQNTADAMEGISGNTSSIGDIDLGTVNTESDVGIDTKIFEPLMNTLSKIKQLALDVGNFFKNAFGGPLLDAVKSSFPAFAKIKDKISDIFSTSIDITKESIDIMKSAWEGFDQDLIKEIGKAFKNLTELFNIHLNQFTIPVLTNFLEEMSWLWDKHLKGLVEELSVFIGKLSVGALEIYNSFIHPIVKWLYKNFYTSFASNINLIVDILGTVLGAAADVAKGIITSLGGIIDFLAGAFTGDWERAWVGVQNIFKGISDALTGIFKGNINLIIDAVNYLVRGLNKIKVPKVDIPGIGKVGGWGFDIKEIPKLATGGIITQPTLAMMGENSKKEAVIPLENSSFITDFATTIAQAVAAALSALNTNNNKDMPETLVLKVGEFEFGRIAIKSINALQQQAGVTLLNV
ncbi:hypothetical protein [Petroclostridium sp. X23]|uniref:hypothetical protein n=1 Tax=Petroclostridium sp. X23 TaxID=3045146 RepID=UPI0024AD844A|nr:hypothetical protein [Petroclostridium sp. X23]WHH58488.1 hypothetical protein QKW49_22245 [Petroclostridium sp. X23]